ncbi:hypothetical protein LTR36_010405 [Oleoguttula mirabilis]|uniref:Uncharacterized protein n=1 Tax=Oleoguttula mirabilis TaxID=1507867 RepID=A0AAV9J4A8_9PEZI|nr:hypothetical protein LTR36_010405 [Oleoguttula mirabilis]
MKTPTKLDKTCHFLKIPPELRNMIYDLAFTSAADSEDYVYFTAAPPYKAIVYTCKQVYHEAKGLYRHAYRRFWTNSFFKIPVDFGKLSSRAIQHTLTNEEVAAIRNVAIDVAKVTNPAHVQWVNLLNHGV